MTRVSRGIASGLLVLALGVVAVAGLLRPEEVPAVPAEVRPPVPSIAFRASTVEDLPYSIAPDLPGVPSGISRVLEWNGDAGFAGEEELAQLPPSVAAVLTQHAVPLMVPISGVHG